MKEFVLALFFLGVGTVFDLKSREIPGRFLFVSAVSALLCNVIWQYQSFAEIFYGILLGESFLVLGWISKESIGYGDGLGMMITGILLGGKRTLLVVTVAFFLSAIYGIGKLLLRKGTASDTMPFYPFLFLAALGGGFL